MKLSRVVPTLASLTLVSCTAAQSPESADERRVGFSCDNGETVEMRFFPRQGVGVLVRNGQPPLELQQQPSGSGFIYGDGRTRVRGKGNELTIKSGSLAAVDCMARSAGRP